MACFSLRSAVVLGLVAPWIGACADDSSVAGGDAAESSGTAGSSTSGMTTVGMTMGGSSSGAEGSTGDPADGSTGDPPGGSTAAASTGPDPTGAASTGAGSSGEGSSGDGDTTGGDSTDDGGSTGAGSTGDDGTTGFGSTGFGSTGFGSTGFGSTGFGSTGFGSSDGGSTGFGSTGDGGTTGFGSTDGGTTTGFDSGDCCLTHPEPGCEDAACTAAVCLIAPGCCIFEWDAACTSLADSTPPCVCDGTGTGGDTAGDTGGTGGPPVGFVLISELRYDVPGADDDVFIELVGPPDLPLDGVTLVAVNGATGMVYDTLDLDGEVVPSNGAFVIVHPDATSIFLTEAADLFSDFADLQNGPDNLVVVRDGAVVDAIGYGAFDPDETFVGEGSPAPDINTVQSLYRAFSTADSDDNSVDFEPGEFTAGLINPGFGDCCMANGTPGCEDLVCQGLVCDADDTCCSLDWGASCAAEADMQIFCPPCS